MVKNKFIKCGCSSSNLRKGEKLGRVPKKDIENLRGEPTFNFDKCECMVDGSVLTKRGRDNVFVDVTITKRKGFELF